MTIITKPSIVIKKPDGTKAPLVEDKVDLNLPVVVEERQPAVERSLGAILCMALLSALVVSIGITSGVLLYRQYLRGNSLHRYQGFCSIPIEPKDLQDEMQVSEPDQDQLIESNYNVQRILKPSWSNEPFQVVSTVEEEASDAVVESLREQFDIGDTVEKIRVDDTSRPVMFLHDFRNNVSGIVDAERCFVMEMDPQYTLRPDLFVVGIEHGDTFDVTRVRSALLAVLPALRDLARTARLVATKCADRPVYRLRPDDGIVIRKRSADAPEFDYMMFAGSHIQLIEIVNMPALLLYEKHRV